MAIHDDEYVPESARPSSSSEGDAEVEPPREPGYSVAAQGLLDTIELGRRVLELAEKLRGSGGDRRRPPSFRILATQLEAPRGASSVWRAAAIYRLAQTYPELYSYRRLGVGHVAVLLSLRGPLQLALLRRAERMGWSRRKLEAKVKRIREEVQPGMESVLLAELESAPETERGA